MKKLMIPAALILLLALGLAVSQEESHEAHHDEHDGLVVLDRNIRLTFALLDAEGNSDEPMSIVTAVPKYKLMALFERAQEDAVVSITGAAGPRNDGHILALLEVEIVSSDDESKTELAVECGLLLESGKRHDVATWGDRTLVVEAEYAD